MTFSLFNMLLKSYILNSQQCTPDGPSHDVTVIARLIIQHRWEMRGQRASNGVWLWSDVLCLTTNQTVVSFSLSLSLQDKCHPPSVASSWVVCRLEKATVRTRAPRTTPRPKIRNRRGKWERKARTGHARAQTERLFWIYNQRSVWCPTTLWNYWKKLENSRYSQRLTHPSPRKRKTSIGILRTRW